MYSYGSPWFAGPPHYGNPKVPSIHMDPHFVLWVFVGSQLCLMGPRSTPSFQNYQVFLRIPKYADGSPWHARPASYGKSEVPSITMDPTLSMGPRGSQLCLMGPRGIPGLQLTKYSYGSPTIPVAPRGMPGLQVTDNPRY